MQVFNTPLGTGYGYTNGKSAYITLFSGGYHQFEAAQVSEIQNAVFIDARIIQKIAQHFSVIPTGFGKKATHLISVEDDQFDPTHYKSPYGQGGSEKAGYGYRRALLENQGVQFTLGQYDQNNHAKGVFYKVNPEII